MNNNDNYDNKDNKRSKRTKKADGDGGRKQNWKEYTATVEEIKSFLAPYTAGSSTPSPFGLIAL